METPTKPLLYAEREEWKDVTPVEQTDLKNPLVPIFYPADYKDALDYFRGIMATGEKSERVLAMTEHIIHMNPAHYTVWSYRWETLLAINAPLDVELKRMDDYTLKHIKYYQVWHHRRLLQTKLCLPESELNFISRVLATDDKNYHTWAYRQWILTHFDRPELWEGELDYVETLLDVDLRNNSAWHHRFFLVFETPVRPGDTNRDAILRRELRYVKYKINRAPNNPSAWNYLRGLLDKTKTPFSDLKTWVEPYTRPHPAAGKEEEVEEIGGVLDLNNPTPSIDANLPCALAIEFLADVALEQAQVDRAVELFQSLGDKYDTVRERYWSYRIKEAREDSTPAKA